MMIVVVGCCWLLLLPLLLDAYHFRQRDCRGSIRHVHLAVGRDPATSMTVSFSSTASNEEGMRGGVILGTNPHVLQRVVAETDPPLSYHAILPRHHGNYSSPYQHHVIITGLEPNTTYYYQCVLRNTLQDFETLQNIRDDEMYADVLDEEMHEDATEAKEGNRRHLRQYAGHRFLAPPPYDSTRCACPDPDRVRSFTTAPPLGTGPTRFAIVGDLGQFPHSEETLARLQDQEGIQAIMLAGDIAYSEQDHRKWDTFFDFLDDYPLDIPLQITPGNHDIDKFAHGADIFLSYETRFRMPRAHGPRLGLYEGPDGELNMDKPPYPLPYEFGNAYYSFRYGLAHFVVLSSYSAMEPESKQHQWLLRELKRVNRDLTPWLLVMFHCPIYNSFRIHQGDVQILKARRYLEPILVDNRVNFVFAGHIHAYQRTVNVALGKPRPTGPIHIVTGAGGRAAEAQFLRAEREDWLAVRDATIYGYGVVELLNATHARWDWIHTGQSSDHNQVWKQNISLPIGGADGLYVENQLYIQD